MPYAIMRFEKRKGGPATAIEKHHERTKERYGSNPDIDRERSISTIISYSRSFNITERLKPALKKRRKKIRN